MGKILKLMKNRVMVVELEFGIKKSAGGIIFQDDDGTDNGIRTRWARVYDTASNVTDVEKGDYVLLKHGRWTRAFEMDTHDEGLIKMWMIDYPDAILLKTKNRPRELNENTYKTFAEIS